MQLSLSFASTALLLAIVSAAPASQSSSDVSASASALDYASVIASMMEASGSSVSAVPMEYFMIPQLEKRATWDDREDDDDKDYDSDDSKDEDYHDWDDNDYSKDGDYHDWDDEYHEGKHSDGKKDDHDYQGWYDKDFKKQKDDDFFGPFGGNGLFSPIIVPRPPPTNDTLPIPDTNGTLPIPNTNVVKQLKLQLTTLELQQATETVQVVGLFEPLGLNSSPIGPAPSSA
ncbi:hypothetical protein EDC96DRAFT_544114 [Choanephora cucurbitarum]|nr:hypothetical protein EDC96DRAFT_544114 [Choanephora cucurbitarum]